MPLLNSGLEDHDLPAGTYGFSATRIADLQAAEYTLVSIVMDVSPSVAPFLCELNGAVKSIVGACKYSPRADNLLVRLVQFSSLVEEVHGFKLLEFCNPADYDNALSLGGGTALYDGAENGIAATGAYATDLTKQGFSVNGIVFVLTDGDDNSSTLSVKAVKGALDQIRRTEPLESLITVLIGVNVKDPVMANYLKKFHQAVGFTQYIELENADTPTLIHLADFVSRSISAQSVALASGRGGEC
ncbi:MAG: hypothetical protein OHK0029_26770 [Armatimonadaceae bacterium]